MTWFRREPDVEWINGFGDDAKVQKQAVELVSKALP
jgi:tRNA dimethylallyltransferase